MNLLEFGFYYFFPLEFSVFKVNKCLFCLSPFSFFVLFCNWTIKVGLGPKAEKPVSTWKRLVLCLRSMLQCMYSQGWGVAVLVDSRTRLEKQRRRRLVRREQK